MKANLQHVFGANKLFGFYAHDGDSGVNIGLGTLSQSVLNVYSEEGNLQAKTSLYHSLLDDFLEEERGSRDYLV